MIVEHPFEPVCFADSKVLILGSMPSRASRADGFYYGHPRNRFWPLAARLFEEAVPRTKGEKIAFLRRHRLALWDVLTRCEIEGSADLSIRNPEPADLAGLLRACPIALIVTNGKAAGKWYDRLLLPKTGRPALCLPSTSPANAAYSLDRLTDAWRVIFDHLPEIRPGFETRSE